MKYMKKFDPLLYILNKLDRQERVRMAEMAQELGVSERTIYRYLNSLLKAGFPIYYEQERGTYAFTLNFSLRQAFLGTEEVLVLALAIRLLEPLLGKPAVRILEQIENKVISSAKKNPSVLGEIFGMQGLVETPLLLDLLRDLSRAIRERRSRSLGNFPMAGLKFAFWFGGFGVLNFGFIAGHLTCG